MTKKSVQNESFSYYWWWGDVLKKFLMGLYQVAFGGGLSWDFPGNRAREWLGHVTHCVDIKLRKQKPYDDDYYWSACIDLIVGYLRCGRQSLGAVLQGTAGSSRYSCQPVAECSGQNRAVNRYDLEFFLAAKGFGVVFIVNTMILAPICVTNIYFGDLSKVDEKAYVKRQIHQVMTTLSIGRPAHVSERRLLVGAFTSSGHETEALRGLLIKSEVSRHK